MKKHNYSNEDAQAALLLLDEPEQVQASAGFLRNLEQRLDEAAESPRGYVIPVPALGIALAVLLLINIISVTLFLQSTGGTGAERAGKLQRFSSEYAIENYSGYSAGETR